MPWRAAASTASATTSGVVSESAGEDAAGVEPAHAERRRRGGPSRRRPAAAATAAVWPRSETPTRAADAEAALGEVEPVADGAADAVVRHPADERRVDAALQDEVLDQPPDLVVGERGHDRGAQAEAAAQAAGDVVLAAALPDPERARGADAALAGIEAEHDLAERDEVEPALLCRPDRRALTAPPPRPSATASRQRVADRVEVAARRSARARPSSCRRRRPRTAGRGRRRRWRRSRRRSGSKRTSGNGAAQRPQKRDAARRLGREELEERRGRDRAPR